MSSNLVFSKKKNETHNCRHNFGLLLFCTFDNREDADSHTMDPCKCLEGTSGTASGTSVRRDSFLWDFCFSKCFFSLRDFSVIGVRQRVSERFHARLYLFFTFASIVSEAAIFSFRRLAFTRCSGFKNGQFRSLCYPRFVLQFWYCFVFNIASTRLVFIDEPALVRG